MYRLRLVGVRLDLELLAFYMEKIKIKYPPHTIQNNKFQVSDSSKCEKQNSKTFIGEDTIHSFMTL